MVTQSVPQTCECYRCGRLHCSFGDPEGGSSLGYREIHDEAKDRHLSLRLRLLPQGFGESESIEHDLMSIFVRGRSQLGRQLLDPRTSAEVAPPIATQVDERAMGVRPRGCTDGGSPTTLPLP